MKYEPWIKLKESLDREDCELINALQELCIKEDQITLKLELDYKLGDAAESAGKLGRQNINEFLYFDGKKLVGYVGICGFGGPGSSLEITGMVHPEYRQQGIFSYLHELVMEECKRRKAGNILVLCDRKSVSGRRFIDKLGAAYHHSEYELYLQKEYPEPRQNQLSGVVFRKAANADAVEVARQNAIYFGDCTHETDNTAFEEQNISADDMILPEDEEKRGMTIYLAEIDKQIIGKVHLQLTDTVGGIYGLGVLPEYRGKGLGRALLLKAVEKLKESRAEEIMLQVDAENVRALHLYTTCGFEETSTMEYYQVNL